MIYDECTAQKVKVSFNVMEYGFSVVFYGVQSEEQIEHISIDVDTNPAQIRQE